MPTFTITGWEDGGGMPVLHSVEAGSFWPESGCFNDPWNKILKEARFPLLMTVPDRKPLFSDTSFRPKSGVKTRSLQTGWGDEATALLKFPCTFTPFEPDGPQPD